MWSIHTIPPADAVVAHARYISNIVFHFIFASNVGLSVVLKAQLSENTLQAMVLSSPLDEAVVFGM